MHTYLGLSHPLENHSFYHCEESFIGDSNLCLYIYVFGILYSHASFLAVCMIYLLSLCILNVIISIAYSGSKFFTQLTTLCLLMHVSLPFHLFSVCLDSDFYVLYCFFPVFFGLYEIFIASFYVIYWLISYHLLSFILVYYKASYVALPYEDILTVNIISLNSFYFILYK